MSNTIFPTKVGTANFRVPWSGTGVVGSTRQMWYSVSFLIDGSFPSTYTEIDFLADAHAWLDPIFQPIFWNAGDPTFLYWRLNFSAGFRQTTSEFNWSTTPVPFPRNIASGAAVFLKTARHDRSGTGRVHWPFIQDSDYALSYFNGSLLTRLAALHTFYTSFQVISGVTFTPCVWSRLHNDFNAVTSCEISQIVSYLRKRAPKRNKPNRDIAWPSVW